MLISIAKKLKKFTSKGFAITDVSLAKGAMAVVTVGSVIAYFSTQQNTKVDQTIQDITESQQSLASYFNSCCSTTTGNLPVQVLPKRIVVGVNSYRHALDGALTFTLNGDKSFDVAAAGLDNEHCLQIASSFNKSIGRGTTDSMQINATTALTSPGTGDAIADACVAGAKSNSITFVFTI